jgi:hypothetical protein
VPFELILSEKVERVLVELARDRPKLRKAEKCFAKLEEDPRQTGLSSHPYDEIVGPLRQKIFESYVGNNAPSAWRVWWYYGPEEGTITVADLGPHP